MELIGGQYWKIVVMLLVFMGTQTHARFDLRRQGLLRQSSSKSNISEAFWDDVSPTVPQVFFEVTRPIRIPNEKPCSVLLLDHEFGYTYGKPPVVVEYTPPANCYNKWSKVIMEWKATCKGKQFDRIAGVWLSGVEILRTCSAEPTPTGIEWTIQKDITKYSSLLQTPQSLVVELNNVVDSTYTGVYHVNITFHFYEDQGKEDSKSSGAADLILPISLPSSQNGGYWYKIQNASDVQSKSLQIPPNAYKAVLEIFVSFHSSDEFWYANPPNVYIDANNLTDTPGNGPFREVMALIDGMVVGAVWPFPVIYTGGINPLFWRPVIGIGAFDLPSYDLEVTPFMGKVLDGKEHTFSLSVTNALSVWFIDANLHLWLDEKSVMTRGKLVEYEAPTYQSSLVSNFKHLDGSFHTYAKRKISYCGWVGSSYGNLTTHFSQEFKYENLMTFHNSGTVQIVHQRIQTNSWVVVETPTEVVLSAKLYSYFPMYVYSADVDQGNGTLLETANISNAFNMDISIVAPTGSFFSTLNNTQDAQGFIYVKGNLVSSGLGSTQQTYKYRSTKGCYSRTVSVSNYTFLSDYVDNFCGDTA
eukprot:Gb_00436 [translate_table: standard]